MKNTRTSFFKSLLLLGLLLTLHSLPTVQAATNCAVVTEIPKAQCDTLLALYNNTGGANWTNKTGWNETNTPCSWYGVTCGGGNVNRIELSYNNLKGSLPDLSVLTGLQSLSLNNNRLLTGTIPDLSKLTSLQTLLIYNSQLAGTIPDLSKLTNLQTFYLGSNQLTGTIPDLSKLTNLRTLYLGNNQLTGTIPDLSKLTNLQELFLFKNRLTGTIPDLSKLTSLQTLYLGSNQLTGTIPDLSKLTSLRTLYLGSNQLTGTCPDLSKLTNLEDIYLESNQLSGTIPDLSQLTNLWGVDLSNNQLTGTLPNLSQLTNLWELNLSNNQLTGTIPELNQLTNLWEIDLSNNQLTGPIPDLSNLGSLNGEYGLRTLDLSNNQLTGTIPDMMPNAIYLNLSHNQLTGTIPVWVTSCGTGSYYDYDDYCDLSDNQLSGSFYVPSFDSDYPFDFMPAFDLSNNPQVCMEPDFCMIRRDEAERELEEMEWDGMGDYDDFMRDYSDSLRGLPDCGEAPNIGYVPLCPSIAIIKSGMGTGNVKTSNAEIDCGPTCQTVFAPNTPMTLITLTATPSAGTTFQGWSGDCNGTTPVVTVKFNEDTPTVCTATFTPPFCNTVTQIPSDQCQTLLTLYTTTNGPTWTHQDGWNTTSTPCQWYGVECTNGQVTALRLNDNNLKGILPVLPTTLETFIADGNQLSGPLTPVSTLISLRTLSLSNNQLGDALPDLGQLTQLELLNLNNNQLAGPIPDLRKLTQLKQLLLKDNHLAGPIPTFTVTDTFDLSGNDQLCRDSNLTYSQPELNTYPPCSYPTLTVAKTGSGIGLVSATSPTDKDKLTCGQECTETNQAFTPDSTVTLTATPTDGTVFTGWLGECNGDTETTTVTLDQAKTCVANFEIKAGYYELQVSKAGIGKGIVTTADKNDPLHCDAKCQETRESYPAGTAVTLRAETGKGSIFTGWGGACSGTDKRLTITLDQAQSCFATFNLKEPPPPTMRQLIINTDAGSGNGTVTAIGIDCGIDCLENYREGINVKLTATPHAGSSFLGWEDDCGGKDPTLTVKMTDNKLCTAFFANDVEMVASETVTDFYANGYLDTGEEVKDRYPRYPDNDQRLQEAFSLAQPAILTVDLQVDVNDLDATWPIQFNDGISFFRLQPAGRYTESVKILKDAVVEGYLSPALVVGYYVEVRVKLLNYLGGEEWVPILTYYGDAPTIEEVTGAKRADRSFFQFWAGIAFNCGPTGGRPGRW